MYPSCSIFGFILINISFYLYELAFPPLYSLTLLWHFLLLRLLSLNSFPPPSKHPVTLPTVFHLQSFFIISHQSPSQSSLLVPYRFYNFSHPLSLHHYHFIILRGFTIHVGDSFCPASLCHDLLTSSNVFLYLSHPDLSLWHLWLHRTCHNQYLLCLQNKDL